jgi:hypothetical protein
MSRRERKREGGLVYVFIFGICLCRWMCKMVCIISGWELDAARAWKDMRCFKWTEFCPSDRMIAFPLSLHLALIKARNDQQASLSFSLSLSRASACAL